MVNNYNTFDTSIWRISIEASLENATAYGGIIPLLDYVNKIKVTDYLGELLSIRKQDGDFRLSEVATVIIIGCLLGMERISHFEDLENEILLKRYFGWQKLPDYTTYYHDLQRFKKEEDIEGFRTTNQWLTEQRVLSK